MLGLITLTNCKQEHRNQETELNEIFNRNTIIIKGSDTELPMVQDLAKLFRKNNSEITIDITGGGSSDGIEALINNETDIANSSREIKASEIARAKLNGVNPTPIMFSVDALAIITHSKLGIDSLSTEQMMKIFSG